ncbi:hypothetical protein HYR54_02745 [Candidatus Acetothermia bacterium]|nr:hypothetical protein [Candidatus Acetothermia bacterium]
MAPTRDELPWGKELMIALGLGIIIVLIYGGFHQNPWQAIAVALVIAGAAIAAGMFVGFLFGIPRSLQKEPQTGGAPNKVQGSNGQYAVNTNLEQISDWLTKIIVGVGLVQLNELPHKARIAADYLGTSFGASAVPGSIILSITFYFAVFSFLLGYLWTRLHLASEFSKAEREAREKPEYFEGLIHAFLYQPKPGGFERALEKAEEYNDRFGPTSSERVWEYLACAYGQQYDYLSRAPKLDDTALKLARDKALEAVQHALQINSEMKTVLKGLWDPQQAKPSEDDLVVFFGDDEFKKLLG